MNVIRASIASTTLLALLGASSIHASTEYADRAGKPATADAALTMGASASDSIPGLGNWSWISGGFTTPAGSSTGNVPYRPRPNRRITKSRKPNILFILTDQWRGNATGYAGDPNVRTPNLDRLAAQGLNFCNAVSVCPVCTPFRAALMTGRFPLSTGVFLNDARLPSDELCMPEILKNAGYTSGFIGKWHLDGGPRTSYIPPERRHGWEYWKACECTHDYNYSPYFSGDDSQLQYWQGYDAFAQTRDAQNYLAARASDGRPFVLMLSLGPPHFAYNTSPASYQALYPPDQLILAPNVPLQMQAAIRPSLQGYYAHCTALDDCVSNLLATLDATSLATNTIVVFTADHGESMGSHGNDVEQKQLPWDESARVPFLLRWPALEGSQGITIKTPLTTPDILPTLLGLIGVPIPERVEGADLSEIVRDPASAEDRAALYVGIAPFATLTGEAAANNRAYRAIRTSQYTYVRDRNGPWLMYNDELDPYQTNNLLNPLAVTSAALQGALDSQLQAEMAKRGDEFLDARSCLDLWGFTNVPVGGSLSYSEGVMAQPPVSDYDKWAKSFNLPGTRTPETIYCYAVGANPTNSAVRGFLPTLVVSSDSLQYVYARRRAVNSSIVYRIEATDSLTSPNWTKYPSDIVGAGVLNAEFNRVTNRISAGKNQEFIRLVVE